MESWKKGSPCIYRCHLLCFLMWWSVLPQLQGLQLASPLNYFCSQILQFLMCMIYSTCLLPRQFRVRCTISICSKVCLFLSVHLLSSWQILLCVFSWFFWILLSVFRLDKNCHSLLAYAASCGMFYTVWQRTVYNLVAAFLFLFPEIHSNDWRDVQTTLAHINLDIQCISSSFTPLELYWWPSKYAHARKYMKCWCNLLLAEEKLFVFFKAK